MTFECVIKKAVHHYEWALTKIYSHYWWQHGTVNKIQKETAKDLNEYVWHNPRQSTMRPRQQVVGWRVEPDSGNGCGSDDATTGRHKVAPNCWIMYFYHQTLSQKEKKNIQLFFFVSEKPQKGLKGLFLSTQRHSSSIKQNSCRLVLGGGVSSPLWWCWGSEERQNWLLLSDGALVIESWHLQFFF